MRERLVEIVALSLLAAGAGCAAESARALAPRTPAAGRSAPMENLGGFHRAVTTSSPEAQKWFDQGLVLTYGYNHAEAIRSYRRAIELDPECAMAWWGIAYAYGPHINNPAMDEDACRQAFDAASKAQALAPGHTTEVERALIDAVVLRYAWPPPADRVPLERAYADAMRGVSARFPHDADVGALFAEALMDLRPWDLWTPEGEPRPETPEILEVLDRVIAQEPRHVLANHLYIHAVEASPDPARALPSADRLRDLVPGSGHLVHMPSHIDVLLGHYEEAVLANQLAAAADQAYVAWSGERGGFYAMYRAHTLHFLAYAAMFEGRHALARQAADDLVAGLPPDVVASMPDVLEGFLGLPYHVAVRFGRWDEILAAPEPPAGQPATRAVRHYARGVALAVLGRVDEAQAERQAFEAARGQVPETAYTGNNPTRAVLEVASAMLDGELAYRRGDYDRAFTALREAVARDDALRYDEPWGWMQPVRHSLGALLLEQGRVAEAENVYRNDLARHPDNGWSLHGLAECLRRQDRGAEAQPVEAAFKVAWARADTELTASCFCRRG